MLRKENGATVDEANKSGDNSLRDWFGKSKSSDGKPGWVQLGGKYAGKPCKSNQDKPLNQNVVLVR